MSAKFFYFLFLAVTRWALCFFYCFIYNHFLYGLCGRCEKYSLRALREVILCHRCWRICYPKVDRFSIGGFLCSLWWVFFFRLWRTVQPLANSSSGRGSAPSVTFPDGANFKYIENSCYFLTILFAFFLLTPLGLITPTRANSPGPNTLPHSEF